MLNENSSLNRTGPSDLVVLFAIDVHELIRIGALVDKGGTLGLGAGLGYGIGAAVGGHWSIALGSLLVGAFVKHIANKHKETRFTELGSKWRGILGGLNETQLRAFVVGVGENYPGLQYALQTQFLGTSSSSKYLGF